jgi:flagellar FliL protein
VGPGDRGHSAGAGRKFRRRPVRSRAAVSEEAGGCSRGRGGGARRRAESPASAGEGKGPAANANSYEVANIVVNLSGTMGTRYLKTTFTVTGPEKDMKATFEANKPRLTDVTLNVLSALSLSELEEPGAKNLLRGKLVTAYNQALGHHAVDQVYFSDFLIQ